MNHVLAIDHLTDWSLVEWWLYYLGALTVPLFAAALACAGCFALKTTLQLELPTLAAVTLAAALTAGAFAVVFLGLNWHIDLLYASLRHTSSAHWAVLAGLVVAAVQAAASVMLAAKFGIHRRRRLALIALVCAVPAIFSLVGDGFHRAAISTARDSGCPSELAARTCTSRASSGGHSHISHQSDSENGRATV